jgi:hypothetical protein
MKKTSKLWTVNIVSFVLFIILSVTGLIKWLVLPKGYELRGSFLISIRHFLIEVHQWAGLVFILVVAMHVILHWGYIKAQLLKSGTRKRI